MAKFPTMLDVVGNVPTRFTVDHRITHMYEPRPTPKRGVIVWQNQRTGQMWTDVFDLSGDTFRGPTRVPPAILPPTDGISVNISFTSL